MTNTLSENDNAALVNIYFNDLHVYIYLKKYIFITYLRHFVHSSFSSAVAADILYTVCLPTKMNTIV